MSAARRVGAIVLAAGRSVRMGGRNKLLASLDGAPLVRRSVEAVVASRARPVCVVTGHEAEQVREALAGCPVELVHNPDFAAGMSTSLRAGIEALAGRVDGALVCLADMPWVPREALDALIDAFADAAGDAICAPHYAGRRGNPVLWPAARFADLVALRGDAGARALLEARPPELRAVSVSHEGVLRDVDTPEALRPAAGAQ
jgi:molybdenum cofactor cytidylyltransferase